MGSAQQNAVCILQFGKTESVITAQNVFHKHFWIDPHLLKNIYHWYHQFEETECLCMDKNSGQPLTSNKNIRRIKQVFEQSPGK